MINDLTERLTTLSNQLEATVVLSTSLQAQHTTARNTISALESKVNALESLVQSTQLAVPPVIRAPPPPPVPAAVPENESLTDILSKWKKTVEAQWSSVREEWATERERLASAREEWELKVKAVESNLGSTAAKFDAGLAALPLLQRQQGSKLRFGLSDADGHKSFYGGLVTPPSPRSLSADSNRPQHCRKRASSSACRCPCSGFRKVQTIGAKDRDKVNRSYSPSLCGDFNSLNSLARTTLRVFFYMICF